MRYHFTLVRMAIIKKSTNNNCWRGCGEKGTLLHQLSLTLCHPTDCSTPGLPVLHHLLKPAQTHVHWVGDAIQPTHPLSPPSPPALSLSQHQGLLNESALCLRWPKYWSFSSSINEYSGLIFFRIDWLISLLSKGLSRVFSTPQFESINSLALSLLYGPTLTSIHDYWKNHSLD